MVYNRNINSSYHSTIKPNSFFFTILVSKPIKISEILFNKLARFHNSFKRHFQSLSYATAKLDDSQGLYFYV